MSDTFLADWRSLGISWNLYAFVLIREIRGWASSIDPKPRNENAAKNIKAHQSAGASGLSVGGLSRMGTSQTGQEPKSISIASRAGVKPNSLCPSTRTITCPSYECV